MKSQFLFLALIPLLLNGCVDSGGGWTSSNYPDYNGKSGPDGELILANAASHEGSNGQVASNPSSDNAHKYHRYDQATAHDYAGGKYSAYRKSSQYAGGSTDAHPSGRSSGAAVSSEAMPGATQK